MFSKQSQAGQKNKTFYSNTSYGFEYKKMLIKRKNRAGKANASRMLLSFKTLVTYKKNFLTPRRTVMSVVKQLSLDITRELFVVLCQYSRLLPAKFFD